MAMLRQFLRDEQHLAFHRPTGILHTSWHEHAISQQPLRQRLLGCNPGDTTMLCGADGNDVWEALAGRRSAKCESLTPKNDHLGCMIP